MHSSCIRVVVAEVSRVEAVELFMGIIKSYALFQTSLIFFLFGWLWTGINHLYFIDLLISIYFTLQL